MLKTIKDVYLTLAKLFDPAMEGDPYEKESVSLRTKSRHQAKNSGWFSHRWVRV